MLLSDTVLNNLNHSVSECYAIENIDFFNIRCRESWPHAPKPAFEGAKTDALSAARCKSLL